MTITATPTTTRTDAARLEVAWRAVDGASVVRTIRSASPLGLRQVRDGRPGWAAVRLVQTAACLVAGDVLALEVCVAPRARLALRDVSALLAHPMHGGGAAAVQRLDVVVGEDARLELLEEPLVVAAGARVVREVAVTLSPGAVVLHRETLVLGRHGEGPGAVRAHVRVTRDGAAVLDDTLDTSDLAVVRSPAVLGAHRCVGSLALHGAGAAPLPADAFVLGPHDTLVRRMAGGTRALAGLDGLAAAWGAAMRA